MVSSEFSGVGSVPGAPSPEPADGKPTGAWLGSQSIFDRPDQRKMGRALVSSVVVHGLLLVLLVVAGRQVVQQIQQQTPLKFDVVFLKEPGPGGGGGGSPKPAPPKKLEIPKPKPVEPMPVPAPPPPVPPPPTLQAPVQTNLAQTLQAEGLSNVSLSKVGGAGVGSGIGPGRGPGLGEGTGGGTGGGAYQPGNGVSWPTPLRQVDPQYTSEAMRAKVQGEVHLSAVVAPNGMVTDIKVAKSLDRVYGLDEAAIDAAKKWLFAPCKRENKPVPCQIEMVLEFRLH
jgi:periplasmic protein TonB